MRWTASSSKRTSVRLKQALTLCFVVAASIVIGWGCARETTSDDVVRQRVDSLNASAYGWHYCNVDSVRVLATTAYEEAERIGYATGQAEALNNLAFERFQQMDFDSTLTLTMRVEELTGDAVECLVADVMQMRVAQRTSDNLAFFRHRSHALQRISRLQKHKKQLDERQLRRFNYGCGDMHIVASTYFYYLDQRERAITEIEAAEPFCQLAQDTAQWLYYCYMHGSGGLSRQLTPEAVANEEFDYLLKCFWVARRDGYLFFEANAVQSMAVFFADSVLLRAVRQRQPEVVKVLEESFGEEAPAPHMAEAALETFTRYDDLYQRANALRTLGELAFDAGDYLQAVNYFDCALECVDWQQQKHKKTVPVWIGNIHERMSMAYSALDMKEESDYYRNRYLDMLDITREDAELESRKEQLHARSSRQRLMLVIVVSFALLTAIFLYLLVRTWRHRTAYEERLLRQRFQQIQEAANSLLQQQAEEQELIREQQAATEQRLLRDKRQNVEKRAKLQLVQGIMPFLDRIIHEVRRMKRRGTPDSASLQYVDELSTRIIHYNDLLTDWIQMEQGQISLQLTSFPLDSLFDSLRKSHFAYEQKGITLNVEPTDLCVKADRALTLFMLNTLADNARKFTPEGGTVCISARADEEDGAPFVELSVQDSGVGLTQEDIDLILTHKVYDAAKIGNTPRDEADSHRWETNFSPVRKQFLTSDKNFHGEKGFGFGLMNCKGIIEKYRKTNALFRVCQMGIDSAVGEGSRFWFRLPRVVTAVVVGWFLMWSTPLSAQPQVRALADTVYYCNVEGRYAEALHYADSAFQIISRNHVTHHRNNHERLTLTDTGTEAIELVWLQRGEPVDFSLLLGLRNEIAVAALALKDWELYRYNNTIYTRLYKLSNQDTTLETFCEQTERAQQRDRYGLFILVALILLSIVAFYLLWALPRLRFRKQLKRLNEQELQQLQAAKEVEREQRQEDIELAEDEHHRRLYEEERLHVQNQIIDNCLSTIKHETMYYPGRIQQLARRLQTTADIDMNLLDTLAETADYYKEVHTLLSEQAQRQSEAVNFRRRNIQADELLEAVSQRCKALSRKTEMEIVLDTDNRLGDLYFRGDPDLIEMLMEQLIEAEAVLTKGQGSGELQTLPLRLMVKADGTFARFTLENQFLALEEDTLHDLFMPHDGGVPFLVAKQIIREHDTFLGHPGCRIAGEPFDEGHVLWFTLPLNIKP